MTFRKPPYIECSKISIFLVFFLFFSCQKEEIKPIFYQNVAEELHPYFQKFELEAARRGKTCSLAETDIIGRFGTLRKDVVGLCSRRAQREIIIDKWFWERSSELSKELIVFHELGHCFLKRKHSNKQSNDGTCSSIMRSGKGGCIDFYTAKNRSRLLDELFDF